MNRTIDLNADVGEGLLTDADLMPFISSANIACGYHAGDKDTMLRTIELCLLNNVAIGAHPSFKDRANFGRLDMDIPLPELRNLIWQQLIILQENCREMGTVLNHIKPHGALYNMSARNVSIAVAIAETVYAFNPKLILFGLSGSHSVAEGVMAGLKTAAEVFVDRTYQPDGRLTPRSLPGALIDSDEVALAQAKRLVEEQKAIASDGSVINIMAETICLHGDSPHAVSFARIIFKSFTDSGIKIQSV